MNYYNEIKNELINNEINRKVKNYSINKSDLNTYYNVGKMLSEAGKHYGEGIIKDYSNRLTLEVGKGYGISNLKRMRQFYYIIEKGVALPHQLSWSHILSILPIENIDEINYYIGISIKQNLSYRELRKWINNKEYERLPEETKNKLITKEETKVKDLVKNPIIIKNSSNYEIISEKILQRLILEDIPSFLKELGNGFTFIENEYKIKLGDKYNYIDLLLYNIKFKCYVVIELKVTELKKEHIGQIQTYMNYIDKNLKTYEEDKTIGIIIVKKNDKYIMEYCSDNRIMSREYELVWYNILEVTFIMEKYTEEEINLINSICKPIDNIDMVLVNSIVNKLLSKKEYEELIDLLNTLFDFAEIPKNIVDKLIEENNKECVSVFLENEDSLYFLTNEEKNKLKEFLNVCEVNIKLKESYDYYYNLLFKRGIRHFKSIKISDRIIEHIFTRYNKLIRIKLIEIKEIGVVVSYINYQNYNISKDEQLLKGIDHINEYGFNIDRDIKNDAIIKKIWHYQTFTYVIIFNY